MKTCAKCHIEKENNEFRTQTVKGKVYLRGYCKECDKAYLREWGKNKTYQRRVVNVKPLPESKECSRCKCEKTQAEFRVRTEKRSTPHWQYLNPTCKACDADITRERVRRQRQTQDGRERHNRWAREFHKRHRDKILPKMKKRRESEHGKYYRKQYDENRRLIIQIQNYYRNKRYQHDIISNIKEAYIVRLMAHPREGISPFLTRQYPEFIKTYQVQIAIKRFLKTKNNPQWTLSYNSERLC